MGSFSETAKIVIDEMQAKGESIGLVRLRLWRPFPYEELRQAVKGAETLVVFDRAVSSGMGGPVCSEVKAALFSEAVKPKVAGVGGGLGGRDMSVKDFERVINRGKEIAKSGSGEIIETVGIRG
jgi:pyruvate ferredoxin oxidoreductase alpha subunit